jgi:hypothetical protein
MTIRGYVLEPECSQIRFLPPAQWQLEAGYHTIRDSAGLPLSAQGLEKPAVRSGLPGVSSRSPSKSTYLSCADVLDSDAQLSRCANQSQSNTPAAAAAHWSERGGSNHLVRCKHTHTHTGTHHHPRVVNGEKQRALFGRYSHQCAANGRRRTVSHCASTVGLAAAVARPVASDLHRVCRRHITAMCFSVLIAGSGMRRAAAAVITGNHYIPA